MTVATRPAIRLAAGVVALEFAAAVSTFVTSTLLPTVAGALDARGHLGLLLAGSTLGLFVALPVAPAVLARLGDRATLGTGLLLYVGGAAAAAAAPSVWAYAAGRFGGGFGGGLLAVFGVSAAIRHLDPALRARVVALSSAMWILPAFVGPPGTLALAGLVGWRWTLLAPLPVVLAGRALVATALRLPPAAAPDPSGAAAGGSGGGGAGRAVLVPVGVGLLVAAPWGSVRVLGAGLAVVGVGALLPAGTARAAPGPPAALAALVLFATGWFGADQLVTVLFTDGYGTSVAKASVVLSAAPLAWAVTSLVVPRRVPPPIGLALAAAGVAVLAGTGAYVPGLIAWTVAGAGIGLAYPGLYLLATPAERPEEEASAVITAEAFGGLLGGAAGGVALSTLGPVPAYAGFAVVLAAAALTATRARPA